MLLRIETKIGIFVDPRGVEPLSIAAISLRAIDLSERRFHRHERALSTFVFHGFLLNGGPGGSRTLVLRVIGIRVFVALSML